MTVASPPYVLQASSHSAQLFRQAFSIPYATAGGVVASGDYAVTQNGTPNMSVNVAGGVPGGQILVPGTSSAGVQGLYYGFNDATINLAIAASNPTNPRIDRVVAQVQDAAYTGAVNSFTVNVVTGTPAGSPVAPSTPASSLSLATVNVAALATTVVTANITDTRTVLAASNVFASGQNTYKTLQQGVAWANSGSVSGTYGLAETGIFNDLASSPTWDHIFYFDPADYAIGGRTTRLRLRARTANGTSPARTFTFGLYPITAVVGGPVLTVGAVVAGSTVAITPSGLSMSQGTSGDFTAPAAGFYSLGVVLSGTTSAFASLRSTLQVRQV